MTGLDPGFAQLAELPTELDPSVLVKLAEDIGVDAVADIVGEYLADTDRLLALLELAVRTRDASKVKVASHQLKSTSQVLGVLEVARLAIAMEAAGSSEVADHVSAIGQAFQRVRPALAHVATSCGAAVPPG